MNEFDTPMFRLAVAQFDQAAELMGWIEISVNG